MGCASLRLFRAISKARMAKVKSLFVCQACGTIAPRWAGRCADCGEWNTVVEEIQVPTGPHERPAIISGAEPVPISQSNAQAVDRLSTGSAECDRVLGGGIVPGSLILVGGDPGIGKSTLMLQVAHFLSQSVGEVLYVSGEESFDQTRMRAERLGCVSDKLLLLTETNINAIGKQVDKGRYTGVVIDSIQSVYTPELSSVPGSVGQVRECTNKCLRLAKGLGIPILLVGHVTKDGAIAGPRALEHLVDTVLYFEGEGKQALRILRSVKNRFGATNEIGVFEMTECGLEDVQNPSALFLDERPAGVSGSIVTPTIEGTRPLLVEVQALVSTSHLGSPRRTVTGVNPGRVSLILAVLEKRAGYVFSDQDVFVNVAGGVRVEEPAADLAIALALVSSLLDRPVESQFSAFGEIGLAGEVRAVDMARRRIDEASKFGFRTCMIPSGCKAEVDSDEASILAVSMVESAIDKGLAG